jgi:acyl-coenzyme A synthetase/AMP-(fatty) acid ligase
MNYNKIEYENNFNLFQYFQSKTLIELSNQQNEDRAAILYQNKKISFRELNENVLIINNYLYHKLGDKLASNNDKNIIGIHLNPDEMTIPVLLAIHSLCSCYLPIDPQLPNERMEYILNDSKPLCIVTNVRNNSKLMKIIENTNVELISLSDIFKDDSNKNLKEFQSIKPFSENDLACVLYTSGSTGLPKGVCLAHFSIMNRINWQWDEFEINSQNKDIGAFKTSLNFVDHISEIFSFILKGLPIVVVNNETLTQVDKLIDLLDIYKITYFVLVPSLLRNILLYVKSNNLSDKLKSVKRWVCSGEALSADLLDLFFDVNQNENSVLSNFYGSTEVTADVTFVSFKSKNQFHSLLFEKNNVPIGVAISNCGIILFDENMIEIKGENKTGEIYACGFCLATGYLNELDSMNKSNKFFIINGVRYFKTGDYGFFNHNLLYFSGRNDSQLKIRGKRINLNELEYYSSKITGIQSFVPLIYDLDQENKIIIAYYKSCLEMEEEKIEELIRENLKLFVFDYMMPTYLIKLDDIPLLYNGKIDKQLLKKLFLEKYLPSKQIHSQNGGNNLFEDLVKEIELLTGFKIKNNDNLNKQDYLNLRLNQLGISSLNATMIYLSLELINKHMKFEDFLSSGSLSDIIEKIASNSAKINRTSSISAFSRSPSPESKNENDQDEEAIFNDLKLNLKENSQNLEIHPFSENDQYSTIVLKMMVETFTKKNVIHSLYPEYQDKLFDFYHPTSQLLKDSTESFIVYDKFKQKFVGGTYIYDYSIVPPIDIKNEYYLSFVELLGANKRSVAKNIKNKLMNATFITTNIESSDLENIVLVNFIEDQIIKIANDFNYDSIISVNTNKLTRVCELKLNFT